jgi:pSer/pThr/pTyr-binding forkhead associated (FHA) protein
MAPEQIQRGPITGAIDQYALAHVLLEMIFRHAFTGENARVQAFQLVQMQIGVMPDAPPPYFVPPRLWSILERALSKNYRERFPSCRAFGHELRAWLEKPDLVSKKPAVLEQFIRPTVPKTGAEARVRTPAAPPTEVPTPAKRIAPGDLSKEPSLYVRNGKNAGARFEIHGRHVIGRHPGYAHIVLEDEGISHKHAVVEAVVFEPPVFNVQDLGSSNGTAVGGIRLSDGESEDNLALVAPLSVGESFVLDSIELLLLAPGRLLPGERWQSLEEAAAEERARLAPKPPAKGGTVKMVQPERTPAPTPRRIAQHPQVDVSTKWLAPTLLVIQQTSVTRFHLSDAGVIGASPDRANILIEDTRVSGGHVRYTKITGDIGSSITYLFEDLQSRNGTFSEEDGARKPVQAHALRSLRSLWLGGFIQLVLLPPGHFDKPGEYVPCDLSGRPISINKRNPAPARLRAPLIILTVALAVAALCWYAFHRLGWL